MSDIIKSCNRLQNWFSECALPLWNTHGYDHRRGGFYESLDFTGAPIIGQPRRVRVQARQIYAFTQSALRGWGREYEEMATKGFDFFLDRACPEEGQRGCVHLLSDDGIVLDDRRDLYDQAFLLLACAARWNAVKDTRALALANTTIEFLDAELSSPHGGWRESDKNELPRRQNPHMHLFESFIILFEVTNDKKYLDQANKIYQLFESSFYDTENGVIRELFDASLSPLKNHDGILIEPGHMAEWVWLLDRFIRSGGKVSGGILDKLFSSVGKIGVDTHGFLLDKVTLPPNGTNQTRRLWPQTEYVKAALVMARHGRSDAATTAAQMINQIFDTYLNQPVAGLWCDQYQVTGEKLAREVPASILYHLYEAAAETSDYLIASE